MGACKDIWIAQIEEIEKNTGYDFYFIQDRVYECIEDGYTVDEAIRFVNDVCVEMDW